MTNDAELSVQTGMFLCSICKIRAIDGPCLITRRPSDQAFRIERILFADQMTSGNNEISKRWHIEKYRVGNVEYLPRHILPKRPVVTPAIELCVVVRYIGPEIDGEVFEVHASGEVVR